MIVRNNIAVQQTLAKSEIGDGGIRRLGGLRMFGGADDPRESFPWLTNPIKVAFGPDNTITA